MALELGVWRIGKTLTSLSASGMDNEARLEEFLEADISIASLGWMIIGRQVSTEHGNFIDLLAIDTNATLIVLELKKDKTPREVIAQLLDYGSWVRTLEDDRIAAIYDDYLHRYRHDKAGTSLDDAFKEQFGVSDVPDSWNESHQLVVVASALDASTERIVTYLADEYDVRVNALFFRVFKDGDAEYLTRAWLVDPVVAEGKIEVGTSGKSWNGEFYVSFGHSDTGRRWEDAKRYGYISAGGGAWYSRTLDLLEPGARVWVNVPKTGYVAVGIVRGTPVRVADFKVRLGDGSEKLIAEVDLAGDGILKQKDNDEKTERLVAVEWLKAVDIKDAVSEKGFFGNQNSVCKPRAKKWRHTVERLKQRFGIQ